MSSTRLIINLAKIPAECERIFVILNLDGGASLEKLKKVFLTVSGMKTKITLAQHDWSELQNGDTLVCCSFSRVDGKWNMEALGRTVSVGESAVFSKSAITNLIATISRPGIQCCCSKGDVVE